MRHIGGEPPRREDSWRRLLMAVGHVVAASAWGCGRSSAARTAAIVGHVGFFDFERDMQPSIAGEPEMGWIFDRAAHGQGYAIEAGTAALQWADGCSDRFDPGDHRSGQ